MIYQSLLNHVLSDSFYIWEGELLLIMNLLITMITFITLYCMIRNIDY